MAVKRRVFLQGTLLGMTSGILGSLAINRFVSSQQKTNTKPNLLILVADDMRWDCLGVTGNRIIQTPNLDKLAGEGTRFLNNFVTTSICATSRASILTGQYARRHKVWDFKAALTSEQFSLSYPVLLRNAGYFVGFIGKWGLGGKPPRSEFDFWQGFEGQGNYFEPNRKEHLTEVLTHQTLDFFNNLSSQKPFCLSISYKAPHAQDFDSEPFQSEARFSNLYKNITIPETHTNTEIDFKKLPKFLQDSEGRSRWRGRFDTSEKFQHSVKQYYRLITGLDSSIGQIVQTLKDKNLYDNTYIIFTSDNGFFLGDRGLSDKWFGYEESIRTPLIIRSPAWGKNQLISAMTLNIDIAPTILDIAGVDISQTMQGSSLMPLILGKTSKLRDSWLYEHLLNYPPIPKSEGIRTQDYKYLRYLTPNNNYEMLFNLKNDPFEENNLVSQQDYQAQLHQLRQLLLQYQKTLI